MRAPAGVRPSLSFWQRPNLQGETNVAASLLTTSGFALYDATGHFIIHVDTFEVALATMRTHDDAATICRVSDGEVCARRATDRRAPTAPRERVIS